MRTSPSTANTVTGCSTGEREHSPGDSGDVPDSDGGVKEGGGGVKDSCRGVVGPLNLSPPRGFPDPKGCR